MGGALDPVVAEGRRRLRLALDDLSPGSRVDVALSGGADSLALAACLSFVAPQAGWMAGAVIVDHGLQPGSDDVAARAAEQATALGLDAEVVTVEVGTEGGPEAAARDARYAVLRARPVDAVLLGHTLDDQAETVLLGLARGSGPRSIAGMPAIGFDGFIRRPFLGMRRTDTEHICTVSGLDWWTDPHNTDLSLLRSRVRHELMPRLEDVLGGGVAEALARTASQVRDDLTLLDQLAEEVPDPCDVTLLIAMPTALRRRALRLAALGAGADRSELSSVHISELDRLVTDWHGQKRVELPGGVSASRVGDALRFQPTPVQG